MEKFKEEKYIPESVSELATEISEKYKSLPDIMLAIQEGVNSRMKSLSSTYQPKSIIESRFTSAEEVYKKGMKSCGAIVNISAEALRLLGFKVKLIHGETLDSVDHAWIKALNPETNEWEQYDLTNEDLKVSQENTIKYEVDSWEEIRDQIEEDHRTLRARRKERGL
ncbi:MAG: hypothetical protein WC095_00550 [Candidatus Paceibacterota bacterium]